MWLADLENVPACHNVSLREAVCHSENLGRAWARFQRYRGLWAPGVPMSKVAADPVAPMLRLAEELRTGRYRPNVPQCVSIAKADGGRRELRVYGIRDRLAQRAVLQVLQEHTDPAMSPFSYGYRPSRKVDDALATVRSFLRSGLSWVVDADIERCFDTIPRTLLLEEVRRRLEDNAAADLIAQVMGWDDSAARCSTGIPQGSVLSPWLCNVYLWRLDDHMRECATAMVRFADDFVLLTQSRRLAERARADCAGLLARLRLRLHPLKTAIVGAGAHFRFLGQCLETVRLLALHPASA